ncbi:MAG TPA: IS110 family transposase [Solirubrobacteraceae bacterium]|jgi:transposase
MIVVGVDAHKRTHTLVAIDARTGELRGQLSVAASDEGSVEALRLVRQLDEQRVWAIEDCRHVSGRLQRALIAFGERVIRIPPALTVDARRAARTPGKSDPIDASAVARVALREGLDRFPAAFLDEPAMDIRMLCDYRDQLISERVRLANRLRWHLLAIDPELESQLRPEGPQIRARLARQLGRLGQNTRVRIAKTMLKRIGELTRQERELEAKLTALIQIHCPQLLKERGCGTITAAILIGHTADARRFANDAAFARHAGTAPIPASSGDHRRYRLHRGGDRQLNRALHIIALSGARTDPNIRTYLDRKATEGKTKREAIRCLKRHLARHILEAPLHHETAAAPDTDNRSKIVITELLLTSEQPFQARRPAALVAYLGCESAMGRRAPAFT